jgi:hypothetical protein
MTLPPIVGECVYSVSAKETKLTGKPVLLPPQTGGCNPDEAATATATTTAS